MPVAVNMLSTGRSFSEISQRYGGLEDSIMKLELLAKILGYAGLIPFLVFSLATWVPVPLANNPHFVLSTYAAVILSFMGAIHWGVAMSRDSSIAVSELGFSVLPALLAWLALLIPALFAYALLVPCFFVLYLGDRYASDKGLLPDWYLPMRFVLTTVVILSLIIAALALYAA